MAIAEGRDVIHAGRYSERAEIDDGMPPLGDAPEWVVNRADCLHLDAWELLRAEAPWLKASHRVLVGMAAQIQGTMMAGLPLEVKEMTLLRGLLSAMGMTPIDASKVVLPQAGPKKTSVTAPRQRR